MNEIGVYEAKTHLPKLLERVAKGETITITRHGMPVANLVPIEKEKKMTVAEAIEGLKALKRRINARVSLKEIQKMKALGRR
ncbi:type II toxin-antitoxin system Phd/YefM family antitoxin [bacterium]|jgi:prevent-host-death family protein|nr:MAG: type II toxin-antitoxin system Phd/YefM family antitoxin [bacterium]